jgi:hypothetical protein
MSPRQTVAAALRDHLPASYRVIDYPTFDPGKVNKPTVIVWNREMRHRGAKQWDVDLDVWLLVADGQSSRTEDALDDALTQVLGVFVEHMPGVDPGTVSRASYLDRFPAYRIQPSALGTGTST